MTACGAQPCDVSGRAFLVAGAAGGLARAMIEALHAGGAQLCLTDIDAPRLAEVATRFDGVCSMQADITRPDDLEAAVERTQAQFGRLDGGLNAAGLLPIAPSDTMDPETFRRCIEVNLTGAYLFSRALAPALKARGGGRVLHIASVSSAVSNPNYAAYAGSKAGLAQMIRSLAREWAPEGITVNAIGPALTRTRLTQHYLDDPAFHARAIGDIPMGRLGEPEDLVGAALLLLGPGGAFITGQTIYVDGGRTLV